MRYNKIRKMDISNGPGVRISIFLQGCSFNCKNCFNPETHDFNGGKELTDEVIKKLLDLCSKDYIQGLSILGGEPLHPKNIKSTIKISKEFRKVFGDTKDIWVWSGFKFEDIKNKEVFDYIDVLVDGQFEEELKDIRLKYCGSSNQRIIDIKETLKQDQIITYKGCTNIFDMDKVEYKVGDIVLNTSFGDLWLVYPYTKEEIEKYNLDCNFGLALYGNKDDYTEDLDMPSGFKIVKRAGDEGYEDLLNEMKEISKELSEEEDEYCKDNKN